MPEQHDCYKGLCMGCGIAHFEIADQFEQMHQYQSRVGTLICLCSACRSNIIAQEKAELKTKPLSWDNRPLAVEPVDTPPGWGDYGPPILGFVIGAVMSAIVLLLLF